MSTFLPKNPKILITGGTGFIGSHLIEEISKFSDKVFVPFIDINPKSYFSVMKLKNKVQMTKLDLTDKAKLFHYLKKRKIDFIFHLAAQTIVTKAYEDPYFTLQNNIISTLNILEFARLNKSIKGIIVASSDKAYGKTSKRYTESSPLKGDHPYDVSKSTKDLIAQTYFKTYNVPVVITRFGNVYGEGDLHLSRIIPGICESIIKNRQLQVRSDGTFVRDYIYVKDVVNAYMTLYANFEQIKGEAFNVSSKDTISVINLIKTIERSIGKKIKYKINNNAKNEIPYQHLNWQKIKRLGWYPSYSIESTIPKIIDWYRENVFQKK